MIRVMVNAKPNARGLACVFVQRARARIVLFVGFNTECIKQSGFLEHYH